VSDDEIEIIWSSHWHIWAKAIPWNAHDDLLDDPRFRFDVVERADGSFVIWTPKTRSVVSVLPTQAKAMAEAQFLADQAWEERFD
jgi:hypothetical protein